MALEATVVSLGEILVVRFFDAVMMPGQVHTWEDDTLLHGAPRRWKTWPRDSHNRRNREDCRARHEPFEPLVRRASIRLKLVARKRFSLVQCVKYQQKKTKY
jgi:hypothetical protein